MNKRKNLLRSIDRWLFVCIGIWLANSSLFFLLGDLTTPATVVWVPWDSAIPFLPPFILFYISWFLYIPVTGFTLWHFHKRSQADHEAYKKFCALLGIGLLLCVIGFITVPTQIPEGFRGDLGDRANLFTFLTGLIYDADGLRNAFPSEHCFVAIVFCWGFLYSPALRKSKHRYWVYPVNIIMAIGICMSTVFVKQHSILDFFGALGLFLILVALIYCLPWKWSRSKQKSL